MIEEEDVVFAGSQADGIVGLRLAFTLEPCEVMTPGEFIFTKLKISSNTANKDLPIRDAKFLEYTNDGVTCSIEMDYSNEPLRLYARVVTRDSNGKLQLLHNPDKSRVLVAHEQDCVSCKAFKPCPKSSYHSASVVVGETELLLCLQINFHPPAGAEVPYILLVSTSNRNECVLSAPFKIVEKVNLHNNKLRQKLIARYLKWLTEFSNSILPDDDTSEDVWVELDMLISRKISAIGSLAPEATVPLADLEPLLVKLIHSISKTKPGNIFPSQRQFSNGWTMLHFASALGLAKAVEILPDTDVLDMNDRQPIYYANAWGYNTVTFALTQKQSERHNRAKAQTSPVPPRPIPGQPAGISVLAKKSPAVSRSTFVTPPKLPSGSTPPGKSYP